MRRLPVTHDHLLPGRLRNTANRPHRSKPTDPMRAASRRGCSRVVYALRRSCSSWCSSMMTTAPSLASSRSPRAARRTRLQQADRPICVTYTSHTSHTLHALHILHDVCNVCNVCSRFYAVTRVTHRYPATRLQTGRSPDPPPWLGDGRGPDGGGGAQQSEHSPVPASPMGPPPSPMANSGFEMGEVSFCC